MQVQHTSSTKVKASIELASSGSMACVEWLLITLLNPISIKRNSAIMILTIFDFRAYKIDGDGSSHVHYSRSAAIVAGIMSPGSRSQGGPAIARPTCVFIFPEVKQRFGRVAPVHRMAIVLLSPEDGHGQPEWFAPST